MSKTYVPGPALVYAAVGASKAWLYLGMSDSGVRVVTSPRHSGVQADAAGEMDVDVQFMGEDIMIPVRLIKYVESVLPLCKKRLGTPLATAAGSGAAGSIGALLGLEGNTYELAVVAQYASKTVYSDMVPGFHVPRAYMAESNEVELSTRVKVEQCVFRGLPLVGLDGSYTLYDTNIAALTLPDPS